ncbi:MAG: hypothetical protein WDZ90_02315, partial [Candidatus Paceibacterota bacterium]
MNATLKAWAFGVAGAVFLFGVGLFATNALATISSVTLSDPNGGEEWRGTQTIIWSTDGEVGDTVDIIYSTDGFGSTKLVASEIPHENGSFDWDTTTLKVEAIETDSSTVQVRVQSHLNPIIRDTSDADFTVDNTAPITSFAIDPVEPDETGWYNDETGAPEVTLTCEDPEVNGASSACSGIFYSWENEAGLTFEESELDAFTLYGAPITPPSDGEWVLYYYSEDNAVDNEENHNRENVNESDPILVDTVAPLVSSYTLEGLEADAFFNPDEGQEVDIFLEADEEVTWTSVRVRRVDGFSDRRTFLPGTFGDTETVNWDGNLSGGSPPVDGEYEITFNIKDVAGNQTDTLTGDVGPALEPYTIFVDTEAPEISDFTAPEADAVYRDDVGVPLTFDLETDASELTCTYTVGDNDPVEVACESGESVDTTVTDGFEDGRNDVTITITDAAGNSVSEGPISVVFDNDDTLTVSEEGGVVGEADFDTIQEAFSKATIGDTIFVYDGSYSLDSTTLTLNKSITITGESEAGVEIDGSGIDGYGISVSADNVVLEAFTLLGPAAGDASGNYGIKASHISNFTMIDVTVRGSLRSEIDLNTVDIGLLDGVTADGVGTGGVGIALSHSDSIVLRDVTTLGNDWGGVGLFDTVDGATTDITFEGTNSFGEVNGVYIDAEFGFGVSSITLPGFDFGVRNDTAGTNFTFLQETEADAVAFALAFGPIVADSYIQTL